MSKRLAASPSVAAVIPTLSLDAYLIAAVESITLDTRNVPVDIIVVVDGPPQLEIPGELAGVSVLFTGERTGTARAVNLGVAATEAEYIARLDSDDLWMFGRFEAQASVIRAHPNAAIVGGNASVIDSQGVELGPYPQLPADSALRKELLVRNPLLHSSLMIRRDVLLSLGGYDPDCVRMQDYDLILRTSLEHEIVATNAIVAAYRVHDEQNNSKRVHAFRLLCHISRLRFALARQIGEPLLRQSVRNLAWSVAQLLRYAGLREPRYRTHLGGPA